MPRQLKSDAELVAMRSDKLADHYESEDRDNNTLGNAIAGRFGLGRDNYAKGRVDQEAQRNRVKPQRMDFTTGDAPEVERRDAEVPRSKRLGGDKPFQF